MGGFIMTSLNPNSKCTFLVEYSYSTGWVRNEEKMPAGKKRYVMCESRKTKCAPRVTVEKKKKEPSHAKNGL